MELKPPTRWEEVPMAVRLALCEVREFQKKADFQKGFPVLDQLTDAIGVRSGELNSHWGGPRPVVNSLIGAGLGAMAGYGGGYLAEQFSPEGTFEEGKPRKRFALIGGLLGATPGLYQSYQNATQGLTPFDSWPGPEKQSVDNAAFRGVGVFNPAINVDDLQARIMADRTTPAAIKAISAGMLEVASQITGGSPIVSPWDVARVGLSVGSGAASGLVAGRALGFLSGLSPKAQKDLQEAGWWSGLLRASIPPALGLR